MTLDRYRGALVGLAVGDCLGRPYEGQRTVPDSAIDDLLARGFVLPYSDDTAMALALSESILECGGFSGEDMALRFAREWQAEPHRGYGASITSVFESVLTGARWEEAARRQFGGEGSHGNGGAMRVAPVALWAYPDLGETIRLAKETARVTHTHPAGVDGAVMQAVSVHHALNDEFDPSFLIPHFQGVVETDVFRDKLAVLGRCLDRSDDEYAALHLGNWVAAANSVPAALYAFLSGDDYESVIRRAIRLGGDTDTIAAMAGAIAGARWGFDAIPEKWLRIEGLERLIGLADALYDRRSSQTEPVRCSSCAMPAVLVVTVAYEQETRGGRLLAYCLDCRERLAERIRLAIPIEFVNDETFISLYENGYTRSDPETACELVFGEVRRHLIEAVWPYFHQAGS